jgi:energy-coupling factor transporter ATP-binding protein EcfA2
MGAGNDSAEGLLPPLYDGPVAVRALDDVVAAIMARPPRAGVRIIGVDGPSGSGKSTLARRLAARVEGAVIVKIDDFVAWDDLTEWWPRFDAQVLTPLLAGRAARYQVRDWIHDEFGRSVRGWKTARPAPLVVLEGVTCTRAAAVPALTYAIWVEAPHAVRIERGLRRDGIDHLDVWRRWFAMERAFFVPDGAAHRADLRVQTASAVGHDPDQQVVVADPSGVPLASSW